MEMVTIEIASIVILPEFITRDPDRDTVAKYREVLDLLPEIEVWQNPETEQTCLISGLHRLEAHCAEKYTDITVKFLEGSYEDMVVRSRAGNLDHGLSYSRKQWHQAVRDIVKARHIRANAWIAREARCSDTTIARIRIELEEAGEIPWVEFLQTENGQTIQRHHKADEEQTIEAAPEAENQPFTSPDLSLEDDEEESEGAVEGSKRPDGNAYGVQPSNRAAGEFEFAERGTGEPTKVILKLAQVGEPLALEAGLWINGGLQPIPVTLLVSVNTPPKGMPEISPEHENCLVIGRALAENLQLLLA